MKKLIFPFVLLAAIHVGVAQDAMETQDRLQFADGLLRRDMYDLAAKEYIALSSKTNAPNKEAVLFRLGECYRKLKRNEEASRTYQRIISEFPKSDQVPRAKLQQTLILKNSDNDVNRQKAVVLFESLATPDTPADTRGAALYHLAGTLEQLNRPQDALKRYEQIMKDLPNTDFAQYAGLRVAYMLSRSTTNEDQRRAMGVYLDLVYKSNNPEIAEEACYFAAQFALQNKHYEESANLFQILRVKYPKSNYLTRGAIYAGFANLYAKRYKDALDALVAMPNNAPAQTREEALYIQANALNGLEKRTESLAVYDQLVTQFPQGQYTASAHHQRIVAAARDGKHETVLTLAAAFINPPAELKPSLYWLQFESASALKKDDLAIQNLQLIVEKCPNSPIMKDALYQLARTLQRKESWQTATDCYRKFAERFPKDPLAPSALFGAGVCFLRHGQSDAALREWTQLLATYPESNMIAETLYQKAFQELRSKDSRAANMTLDELARRFPKDQRMGEVFYWRGNLYHQANEKVEAEKMYRAALAAIPPKDVERETMLALGLLLLQNDRKSDAAHYFRILLDSPIAERLGPDRIAWLAEQDCEQGKFDDAIRATHVLLKMNLDKGWKQTASTILGRVYLKKGDRDPAMKAFAEAIATGATTVYGTEASLSLGEMLSDSGKYAEATTHLNDAATRASSQDQLPWRARAYAALARNAEQNKDREGALRYYMSVSILFNDPVIVPACIKKAITILDALNRHEEAQSMRDELKTRYPNLEKGKHTP
ncbi:MAG: tetratricopeptide repeat protein [bacterium]